MPSSTRILPPGALLAMLGAACASSPPPPRTLPATDLLDLYAAHELVLAPGGAVAVDASGQRYHVREEQDLAAGCSLLDDGEPAQVLGRFAVPTDAEGYDRCAFLGASPAAAADRGWVLAGTTGHHCAYRVDALREALRQGQPPRCAVELPAAANPPGGAPVVVGWLDPDHVVVKTAFCCGSSKYQVVDLQRGRSVGLGMSFESRSPGQFPALRPVSDDRPDYWLVQRASDPQAEFPSTIAVVHCARVIEYLDSGRGAHDEVRVEGRRLPAGTALTFPATPAPCSADQGPLPAR